LPAANAGEIVRCMQCGLLSELRAGSGQTPTYQSPPAHSPYPPQVSTGYGPPPTYAPPYQPQFPGQFPPPNPYQSPNPWGDASPGYYPGYYQVADRNRALSKVFAPAIFMQVYSGLLMLGAFALAAIAPFVLDEIPRNEQPFFIGVIGVGVFLGLVLGGFSYFAGMRMRTLRSYTLVMAAVIAIFGIGLLTCLPLVFLGIWPLIVLLDGEVKACFDKPERSLLP
jgi:hypothetical protein